MSQDIFSALERGLGTLPGLSGLGRTCRGPELVWRHGLKEMGISTRVLGRHYEFASWRKYQALVGEARAGRGRRLELRAKLRAQLATRM